MAARSLASLTISFGLVSIPVKIFTTAQSGRREVVSGGHTYFIQLLSKIRTRAEALASGGTRLISEPCAFISPTHRFCMTDNFIRALPTPRSFGVV